MSAISPQEHANPPGRVLVVEDQEPLRLALCDLLRDEGFLVQPVADGVQAVEAAARFEPDVTLMDLRLPGWDGLEATHQIKCREVLSQVIVFTGTDDPATRKWAQDEGVFCFLHKSVSPDVILEAVAQALAHKRNLETTPGI